MNLAQNMRGHKRPKPDTTLDASLASKATIVSGALQSTKIPTLAESAASSIKSIDDARKFLIEQDLLMEGGTMDVMATILMLCMLVTGPNKTAQYLTDGILSIYYAIRQADAVGVFDHGLKDNELVMQELKDQKQALPKLEVLKYCKLSMLSPSLLLFG